MTTSAVAGRFSLLSRAMQGLVAIRRTSGDLGVSVYLLLKEALNGSPDANLSARGGVPGLCGAGGCGVPIDLFGVPGLCGVPDLCGVAVL